MAKRKSVSRPRFMSYSLRYLPRIASADHCARGTMRTLFALLYAALTTFSGAGLPVASVVPANVTGRGANPAITSGRSV